ncbi:hypothetical protein, partial [Streptomyces ossamyceticus]
MAPRSLGHAWLTRRADTTELAETAGAAVRGGTRHPDTLGPVSHPRPLRRGRSQSIRGGAHSADVVIGLAQT